MNVTEATLLKRINRKLAHNYEAVRKPRRWSYDLGSFYRVDTWRNAVIDTGVDLEALARELGVLHENESLAAV